MDRLYFAALLLCFLNSLSIAQSEKPALTEDQYLTWKDIDRPVISPDGNWIAYEVNPAWGDGKLYLYHAPTATERIFERASRPTFDRHNSHLAFQVSPPMEDVRDLKRRKKKEKDLPTDTLIIMDLNAQQMSIVPDLKRFQMPEEWGGWIFYEIDAKRDSLVEKSLARKITKKEKTLLRKNLETGQVDTSWFVTNYTLAEDQPAMVIAHNTPDSLALHTVTHLNLNGSLSTELYRNAGPTDQHGISHDGTQIGFVANPDTTEARLKPLELYYWQKGMGSSRQVGSPTSAFLEEEQMISPHRDVTFTEDGALMIFGISDHPVLKDTTLLDDEIVNVEVWSHTDGRLFTQQESQEDDDRKENYLTIYRPAQQKVVNLGRRGISNVSLNRNQDLPIALATEDEAYAKTFSWEGISYRDVFVIDTRTGQTKQIATKMAGRPSLSPDGKFAVWYEILDSTWHAYDVATEQTVQLTSNENHPFYDELNDRPMHPGSYRSGGWTEDGHILIYDRYDIWKINPKDPQAAMSITKGRANEVVSRIIRLDRDDPYVSEENALVHQFMRATKEEQYATLTLNEDVNPPLLKVAASLDRRPIKAKDSEAIVYTEESYTKFPDLILSDLAFSATKTISSANPQQAEYLWGTIEHVRWTDGEGIEHEGMLAKPENFDPNRKYPMIVNFYERSADGLNRHRSMNPGRSTISYPFYTSNGYVIFNPDIHYRIGHPGLSALEDVMSGTQHIVDMGFIDENKIGLQGHSWGGYQIADIVTRTNMFACAESGAPVVNMISAYGGIRWGSGMSRMFQYEHTQSRLGGTLWEKPELYLENSPIFRINKIETPILIMHNDKDTAVPWYQGIEFFVAMRRLNKPAWMLNYNGEPHWAVKWQNRLDFNKRMFQFFNHYLKDAPMPKWMQEGVPAIEKGINQGYELDVRR